MVGMAMRISCPGDICKRLVDNSIQWSKTGEYLVVVFVYLYKKIRINKGICGLKKQVIKWCPIPRKEQILLHRDHTSYFKANSMGRMGKSNEGLCNATSIDGKCKYFQTLRKEPTVIYLLKLIKAKENALSFSEFSALRIGIFPVTVLLQWRDTKTKAILIKKKTFNRGLA